MIRTPSLFRARAAAALASLLLAGSALAGEVHAITSGAFTEAFRELVPLFEKRTGHGVKSSFGASMGNAPDAIPTRFARGEQFDVIILARPALDQFVKDGRVVPGSQTDLGLSKIGVAVRAGAPKPDVSTVEALRRTLLEAKSIAYSASASGTYLSTVLFQKLGVAEQVMPKATRILSERVGTVVARGDAEIGFQQVSELLPIAGIDYVGELPDEVNQIVAFSAGVVVGAKDPDTAREFIRFLASPEAAQTIARTGLVPPKRLD